MAAADIAGRARRISDGDRLPIRARTAMGNSNYVLRGIGIALCREARNWNFPWRFAPELVVGRHLKFGAHDRQYQLPPFGVTRSEERRVGKECRSRWSPYH